MNALGYRYSEIMIISAMTQIIGVILNLPLGIYAEQKIEKKYYYLIIFCQLLLLPYFYLKNFI